MNERRSPSFILLWDADAYVEGEAGDWLLRYDSGECRIVARTTLYEPV